MLTFIMGAIKIAVLVTVGLIFLLNIPNIMKFIKGEYKIMNKKAAVGKILKISGGIISVLGLAFFGGAFLAKLQGILLQIVPLTATGVICVIVGIICFITGNLKIKNS